jgi:hypothetical protein
MIKVHLYGDLRRYGDQTRANRDTIVTLPARDDSTVARVLAEIGIAPHEVAQIFLNGRLLKAGSSMAPWLGYQTAVERLPPNRAHLETAIREGDRLGLFPRRMAMLVV